MFAELLQTDSYTPHYAQAWEMLDKYARRTFQKMVQYYAMGADTQYRQALANFYCELMEPLPH